MPFAFNMKMTTCILFQIVRLSSFFCSARKPIKRVRSDLLTTEACPGKTLENTQAPFCTANGFLGVSSNGYHR